MRGVLVLFVLFYHRLFAITFDESFSRATGVKVGLYNTLLSVLTALTIVLGMRMMGAMLISSLVIFPHCRPCRVEKSFRGVVVLAGVLSVLGFCAGLTGSYLLSTPGGGLGGGGRPADLPAVLRCAAGAGLRLKTLWAGRCGLRRPAFPLGRGKIPAEKAGFDGNPGKMLIAIAEKSCYTYCIVRWY